MPIKTVNSSLTSKTQHLPIVSFETNQYTNSIVI